MRTLAALGYRESPTAFNRRAIPDEPVKSRANQQSANCTSLDTVGRPALASGWHFDVSVFELANKLIAARGVQ